MAKKITKEQLTKWKACSDGYKYFLKNFPKGGTLNKISDKCIKDNYVDWSNWLWEKCSKDNKFQSETIITGGNRSTITGGYCSTITGGDSSTITGGYRSTITGNRSFYYLLA